MERCLPDWKSFMIKFETGVSFRGVIKQHSGWYTAVREFQAVLVSKVLL